MRTRAPFGPDLERRDAAGPAVARLVDGRLEAGVHEVRWDGRGHDAHWGRSRLLRRGDRLLGIECKQADAPKLTPSIRVALDDLGLDRVRVIYPGSKRYRLGERVGRATGFARDARKAV